MSLLVYNLKATSLTLNNGVAGAPKLVIPASTAGAGARGLPWYGSGDEFEGLDAAAYTALQAQQALGEVAFEWQAFQEYVTYPLLVGSAQTDVYDTDLEIYVNTAGDDANPGTPLAPVKTFPRAWDLMSMGRKKRRIYLAAGSYDVPGGVYAVPPSLGSTGEPVVIKIGRASCRERVCNGV